MAVSYEVHNGAEGLGGRKAAHLELELFQESTASMLLTQARTLFLQSCNFHTMFYHR